MPNWFVSCWLKTALSLLWMVAAGIDGSKTVTLGPRSGVPAGGGRSRPASSRKDWAAVPLQVYWPSWTPSAVEAPGTSRHLPLWRLTKW